jgi:hypothetical protein
MKRSPSRLIQLSDRKRLVAAIFIVAMTISAAHSADLYWQIVDGSGKLIGAVSADFSQVANLQKTLQSTYPGIRLSIKHCRQPTLVESMNPGYGKDWQCGTIVYDHPVIHPKTEPSAIRFPPPVSQWEFLAQDGGNLIMFINQPNAFKSHIFVWSEDYNAFALADAISIRKGKHIYATDLEDDRVPAKIRAVANEIVDANPSEIGGTNYRTRGDVQKTLIEIDCASRLMRDVQSLSASGEVRDLANDGAPWYSPEVPGGRLTLMQRECGK